MTDHRPAGDRDAKRRQRLRERLRGEWMAGAWSRVTAPPGLGHVSLRRIRAGAGLLAISTVIQLWSVWLGYFAPNAAGDPSRVQLIMWWLVVTLGASIWLLVQPWRRRVMIFTVVETTLWTALLVLMIAGGLVGPSTVNVGLELSAFVIGGVGLGLLPFAEVWSAALNLRTAAGMTLLVGLASTIFGGAHLLGVLGNASRGAYLVYDFRLASMLSIGVMMVVAGTLCIAAVRGLAHGQRRAWDIAVAGTVLLLLVTLPLCFVPAQGDLAATLAFLAAPNLVALVVARRRLEAAIDAVLAGHGVSRR
jgi:hypothetical protein